MTGKTSTLQKCRDRFEPAGAQQFVVPKAVINTVQSFLSSKHRLKKVDALETVRALAQHHSELLMTRLPEVCDAVTKEVL